MTRSSPRRHRAAVLLLALAGVAAGCGSGDGPPPQPLVAVVTAFPGELAAVLERIAVEETQVVDGRTVRLGHVDGVPVVVTMTGIGLVNAAATTALLLERFPVTGVVVSGVAGSPHRIGDVVVPATWADGDGRVAAADGDWLRRAAELSASGEVRLERCTTVRGASVCLEFAPVIAVGGRGSSDDGFGDAPFPCQPSGGEVFGCDVAPAAAARRAAVPAAAAPVAVDMETAAIGAEAQRRGVPFIAFRAVSDGADDPLDLPGFPAQFFAYYPLAADNAASAATAFVARLAAAAPR